MKRGLFLLFLFCAFSLSGSHFEETKELPVAFKGRFRPLDAASKLWLYEFYHREKIQQESPLDFLWKIHFLGHHQWDDIPLFWIHLAKTKKLLGLEVNRSHFSFRELQKTILENQEINGLIMQKLIGHEFIKIFQDPTNRGLNEKLELSHLSPGLWMQLKEDDLVIVASPPSPPFHFLTPGKTLITAFREGENWKKSDKALTDEILGLFQWLNEYARYEGSQLQSEQALQETFDQLKAQSLAPNEMALILERQHPLASRLRQADTTIRALPSRFSKGEWFSLKALKVKVYDPTSHQLVPVKNFTLFSDERFENIRSAYLALETSLFNQFDQINAHIRLLVQELKAGYAQLEGKIYQEAAGKSLTYPSFNLLNLEQFYYQYPWIEICMVGYGLAICFYILRYKPFYPLAIVCLASAFLIHTMILAMRCCILQRPPVSNMFETVIYVPWIAVLASFVLFFVFKNSLVFIASTTTALALLILLKLTDINSSLENVQAVLDSQYWLIIHVLMIVASYGIFILGGILGHFYLIDYIKNGRETAALSALAKLILQSMYVGIALLIPGTILGGVWAAESWGRFWDWDPKESWAFISACIYLIFIHAYTFNHIHHFGLAVGSIAGLLAISFTWYGVNYVLGTGLHTYGFGRGGEIYYYLYFLAELMFLFIIFSIYFWRFGKVVEKNGKNAI